MAGHRDGQGGRDGSTNIVFLAAVRSAGAGRNGTGPNAIRPRLRDPNADIIAAPASSGGKSVTVPPLSRRTAPPPLAVVTRLPDLRRGAGAICDKPGPGLRKSVGRREVLFRQGDAATHLFRIIEGAVALERFLEDGRRQLVELLLPGDYCGLASRGRYTATGIALAPATVQASSLAELVRRDDFGWEIMHQFEAQICAAHEHLIAVGRMTARERVISLLLRLSSCSAGERGVPGGGARPCAIHIPLTRGEMGDYLGLSLETVCRVMSDLERCGLITICRRHGEVLLHDPQRLRSLIS
jgi:CRP-like cAMP-binding protein